MSISCVFQEEDVNGLSVPTMRYNDADYRVLDRFQVCVFVSFTLDEMLFCALVW